MVRDTIRRTTIAVAILESHRPWPPAFHRSRNVSITALLGTKSGSESNDAQLMKF
jgi:hypothetical protein